jgi:DUF1680 family protein
MSDKSTERLNVDMTLSDIEKRLEEIKKKIISKLTEGYGYELQDDTLSTWIITIAISNNTPKSEVENDLDEFIQENATDFVDWFWKIVPEI